MLIEGKTGSFKNALDESVKIISYSLSAMSLPLFSLKRVLKQKLDHVTSLLKTPNGFPSFQHKNQTLWLLTSACETWAHP